MKLKDALIKAKLELQAKKRQIELAELLVEKYGDECGVCLIPESGIAIHNNDNIVEDIKKIILEKKHLKQYISHTYGSYGKETRETISGFNEDDIDVVH